MILPILGLVFLLGGAAFAQEGDRDPAAQKKSKINKGAKASKKSGPSTTGTATKPSAKPGGRTVGDLLQGYQDLQKSRVMVSDTQVSKKVRVTAKPVSSIAPVRSGALYQQDDENQAELEKALDQEIDQLYKLTSRYKKSANRGELWLRLAELYVEKARMNSYREQDRFDKAIADWETSGRKGGTPKIDLSVSRSFNRKAIQLYEWFLADFPKDSKVDQALFFLGYNYIEAGELKKGVHYYELLTKQFPKSPYVSESHFALGEYYFDNRDWKNAEKNYRRVLDIRAARLYAFALYKVGWCFYRQGRVEQAIKTLEQVIRHSRKQVEVSRSQGLKAVNRIRLASEALKDIVPFYADSRDFKEARDYFQELGGDKAMFPLLERLAYVYSDTGKQAAARYIFKELLAMKPTAPKAFDYQYQIVQNYSDRGSRDIYREELFQWIKEYGPDSEWARANESNEEMLRKAYEQRESTLRNYTLLQHQTAQNSRAALSQKLAREGYELYIVTFSKSEHIAEMHFFYGELLYDMKKFEAAAGQYNWVVENSDRSNKFYEQSVLNAVLSIEKALPEDADVRRRAGDSLNPLEYGVPERKFAEAAERYIKNFPNGEKVPDIRFKLGRIAYTYNHFDEALTIFQEIVRKYPKSQQAVYSANLILDIYNLRKDYEGLAKAGNEMLASGALKSADVGSEIKDAVERATFKKAQELEAGGKFLESAKGYDSFGKKYPNSKLATTSKFNAAVNYERAGMIGPAIVGYKGVVENRDKKTQAPEDVRKKSTRLLARLYEQTGQYQKAAQEFERYAIDFPKDQFADESRYNAAVLWEGLASYNKAISSYEAYHKSSRKADRREALWSIAEIQERRGALTLAIGYFEQYLQSGPPDAGKVIAGNYKIAKLHAKMRHDSEKKRWFEKTIAVHRKLSGSSGVGASEAAEAKYELSMATVQEMESIRIPANPQKQAEALKKKLDLINRINNEMIEVIKYDDGNYVIAALSTTGRAYDHLSRAIYAAPLPSGLSPEEKKAYEGEIEKIAGPLKQSAIDNFKRAVSKSFEIQVYNKWTLDSMSALNRYDQSLYRDNGDRVAESREIDLMGN